MPPEGLAKETIDPDESDLCVRFVQFLKDASLRRHPTGPLPRFNQGRAAGCVEAEFIVPADLEGDLRVGLFARPATFKAWIRFASASSASDREKDIRGMSIKVLEVRGEHLTPGVTSQDFVLNSHPVMPAANPREFLALLQAMESGGWKRALFLLTHVRAARIGLAARSNPASHLDIPYWSTTPYLFGPGRAVKYLVRPAAARAGLKPASLTDRYLRDALAARLKEADASFDFLVQHQVSARTMPIEDASVEWPERQSPYRRVSTIRIPAQDIAATGRDDECERTVFNPWHCLAEHRPLGGMNRARREIYRAMADLRGHRAGEVAP